ncbi:MAG: hypothetical protein ACFCVD_11280 [Nodosilinea sp.]
MTTEGCTYFSEDFSRHADQIPKGLREVLQNSVREQTPNILTRLLKIESRVSGVSLVGAITVVGLAPILLPMAGLTAPPGFITGALFGWATDIGEDAVKIWLTSIVTQPEKVNSLGLTHENEELLLAETKKLITKINGDNILLAAGICKIISKNGLLEAFKKEYSSTIRDNISTAEKLGLDEAIAVAEALIRFNDSLVETLKKQEDDLSWLIRKIDKLENENSKFREENQNQALEIASFKNSTSESIRNIAAEYNERILPSLRNDFYRLESRIGNLHISQLESKIESLRISHQSELSNCHERINALVRELERAREIRSNSDAKLIRSRKFQSPSASEGTHFIKEEALSEESRPLDGDPQTEPPRRRRRPS